MRQRSITFYEYRGFLAPDGNITDKIALLGLRDNELKLLRRISNQLIPGKSIFEITSDTIHARHYVGVLNFLDIRIEVLPKLLCTAKTDEIRDPNSIVRNLMFMLSYTHSLETHDMDLAILGQDFGEFLEAYIGIFAQRLSQHLRRYGVPKRYVETEANLNHIKGRINWSRNTVINRVDQSRNYCEFSEFSEDNAISRAFKYVSGALSRITRVSTNDRALQRCIGLLDGVQSAYIEPSELSRWQHGKKDRNFIGLIQLTKLFLSKMRADFGSGSGEVFALMFDMNELFEEFVYQALLRNKSQLGIEVRAQKKNRLVEAERDLIPSGHWQQRNLFDTYTDIEVKFRNGSTPLIIDTKYKLIGNANHYGIANVDVYQVLAYRQIHTFGATVPNLLLLYPCFGIPLRKAFQVTSSEATFAAATINLALDLRSELSVFISELAEILKATSAVIRK